MLSFFLYFFLGLIKLFSFCSSLLSLYATWSFYPAPPLPLPFLFSLPFRTPFLNAFNSNDEKVSASSTKDNNKYGQAQHMPSGGVAGGGSAAERGSGRRGKGEGGGGEVWLGGAEAICRWRASSDIFLHFCACFGLFFRCSFTSCFLCCFFFFVFFCFLVAFCFAFSPCPAFFHFSLLAAATTSWCS